MSHIVAGDMTYCEERRPFLNPTTQEREQRWVTRPVKGLPSGFKNNERYVRCLYCKGPVRVHVSMGGSVKDRVEHVLRADSEGCVGGAYFKGKHQLSIKPVGIPKMKR